MPNELQEVRKLAEEHPDWIEFRGATVQYQSIISTQYPHHIDVLRLADIFDDNRGDWQLIVKDYVAMYRAL